MHRTLWLRLAGLFLMAMALGNCQRHDPNDPNDPSVPADSEVPDAPRPPPEPCLTPGLPDSPLPSGEPLPWPRHVAQGDFDGDHHLDLALMMRDGTLSWRKGLGPQWLGPVRTTGSQMRPGAASSPALLFASDFNEDGKTDLAYAAFGQLSVLLSRGDGSFAPELLQPTAAEGRLISADFTGDGHLDIAALGKSPDYRLIVLPGHGDGTFGAELQGALGSFAHLEAADLNHDQKLDLALALPEKNALGVMLGNGEGSFHAPAFVSAGLTPNQTARAPASLGVADFDGDGHVDVVAGLTGSCEVLFAFNEGDGSLGRLQSMLADCYNQGPLNWPGDVEVLGVAELNFDGRPDLLLAELKGSRLTTVVNTLPDGALPKKTMYLPEQDHAFAVGDFNEDGRKDVIAVSNLGFEGPFHFAFGQEDGSLRESLVVPFENDLQVADIDADGRDDLVRVMSFLSGSSRLLGGAFYRGSGDGSFASVTPLPTIPANSDNFRSLLPADFDGDGFRDVALVGYSSVVSVHGVRRLRA